jgi:hypothetical protein
MFNKNDPLIDSVTKVMKENQSIRDAERAVNEEFGIAGKRDLPYQFHAEYDALVEEVAKEALVGGQAKLDVNKNNRLDKHDFKMLRGMKKKPMEEGKMKDIATAKAEKERLEKMEEQQVNTAGKSDKMTSAPATATTLKPLNKPGLPKLGGMTVIQKGAMKEESIKKERGKKIASAILAKMRAKASVMQEVLGPNPGVVKANQMTSAGQAQRYRPAPPKSDMSSMAAGRAAERGPATTAPVNKSRQDYGPPGGGPAPTKLAASGPNPNTTSTVSGPVNKSRQDFGPPGGGPQDVGGKLKVTPPPTLGSGPKTTNIGGPNVDAAKDAAVSRMRQQRSDVRTGGAPGAAADAARPAASKPPASGGRVKKPAATGVPAGMYMVKSNVKGASGLRSIKNIGGGIGGGGNK